MSCLRTAVRPVALVALTVAALTASHAPAQGPPNPIAAQVKATVKNPAAPFTLVLHLRAKEGAGPKIEAAFARALKPTRKEKGCLAYDLNRDAKHPAEYIVYERWQNLAALEAHLQSRHITALLDELSSALAGPPEVRILTPAAE